MANIEIVCLAALFVVTILPASLACSWMNEWDGPLNVQCRSKHQFVSSITSIHSNQREDRRYGMSCRSIPSYIRRCSTRCYWTGYLNDYDKLLNFNCGSNGYINGFYSVHDNDYEDRRWKVRCCKVPGLYLYNCGWTGLTNKWDERQYFSTPSGQITSGVWSQHSDSREDRRWRYRTCKARRCTSAEVLDGTCSKVIGEECGDERNTDISEIEELSRDESYTDVTTIEESIGEGSYTDMSAREETYEDGSYTDTTPNVELNGDGSYSDTSATEELSVDESYADTIAVKESSADESYYDFHPYEE